MLDMILTNVAKCEYEERLRATERYRRFRAVPATRPALLRAAMIGVSAWQQAELRPELG